MREILFRGKRKDNGEFTEGFLFKEYSLFYRKFFWTIQHTNKFGMPIAHYEVDPATVGQFTGLTDKNGKRIFEGDVLRIGGKSLPHWLDEGDIKAVEYNEGAFSPLCDYDSDCGMFVESSECEVIGSILDNPEPPEATS